MNKIYKTIRSVLTEKTVATSELAKGRNKNQSARISSNQSTSDKHHHHAKITHFTTPLHAISVLLFAVFGSSAQAGEIIIFPGHPLDNEPVYNIPDSLFPSRSSLTGNGVGLTTTGIA